jgi:hypothetical protein
VKNEAAGRRLLWRVIAWLALLAVIGLLASSASCSVHARAATGVDASAGMVCSGSPVSVVAAGQKSDEEVVIDGSMSTASSALRWRYREAALAVVERAAANGSAVRVVVFGASGVGARVVFSGSFAPVSTVGAFNLAAANRSRCLATQALTAALGTGRSEGRGTDVAGAVASAIAAARAITATHGSVSLTVLGDGCQAPAAAGPNRHLTDLCGLLARRVSVERILATHAAEFRLGDARGVSLRMQGLGVGRFAELASTARAQTLVRFWQAVCARAHAAACEVGSDLP